MTTDDGYADWLRSNPAPDLQKLVGCHGGYDKITPEAWAEYDRAVADWHERRRTRRVVVRGEGADRDALCICGPYDANADFDASINAGYAVIRDRVAAGGKGWKPR
jgi:hypothetical protein